MFKLSGVGVAGSLTAIQPVTGQAIVAAVAQPASGPELARLTGAPAGPEGSYAVRLQVGGSPTLLASQDDPVKATLHRLKEVFPDYSPSGGVFAVSESEMREVAASLSRFPEAVWKSWVEGSSEISDDAPLRRRGLTGMAKLVNDEAWRGLSDRECQLLGRGISLGYGLCPASLHISNYLAWRQVASTMAFELTHEELAQVTDPTSAGSMKVVMKNSLGAVSKEMALESTVMQRRYQQAWLGGTLTRWGPPMQHHMMSSFETTITSVPVTDKFRVDLELGQFECGTGLQFSLYYVDDTRTAHRMALEGFICLERDVRQVVTQGGKSSGMNGCYEQAQREFLAFSGGLTPLAWLSLATGRHLLALARRNQGNYYRISGSSVAMGYPHGIGPDWKFNDIDEARAFWQSEHPELSYDDPWYQKLASERQALLDKIAAHPEWTACLNDLKSLENQMLPYDMYARGPTTEQMYDTLSSKLGCVAAGDPRGQWRCFRRDPEALGKRLVNGASDRQLLSSSFRQFDAALAQAQLAYSPDGRVVPYYHHELLRKEAVHYLPWPAEGNPFVSLLTK